jgi:GMP synthase-like glutamine amidotransferase
MMERMLADAGGRFSCFAAPVGAGALLPSPGAFDALLVTGSAAAVYEGHPWIAPAKELVRAAVGAGRPTVGICFGHQLMAEAFGGRVEKSPRGWGVGRHVYEVVAVEDWMRPAPSQISCAVSHQDQVVAAPAGARLLARSQFCPIAALAYADGPAMSLQMHPEFAHDYARALLDARKGRIPEAARCAAFESLALRSDRALIALWIRRFFESGA